jgi:3-oxoadipate enol-lactonase
MPFASVNGVKLNFELHGESGDPLVLVHGYTGDITDWRHQLPAFSPSFRVLIADNRGHGKSEAPGDRSSYTVEQMTADMMALVDDLGFERFHLLGHSMGGAIAQEIAIASPERLLSLTLHDTTNSFAAPLMNSALAVWRDYRFKVAESEGMHAVAAMTSPFPPPPHMPAARLEETRDRLAAMTVDAFIGAWEGLAAWQGAETRAAAITAPSLVIYGDIDTQFIIDGSLSLAATIPGAQLAVIPQSGHQPQFERPEQFNAALGAFLNRVAGRTPSPVSFRHMAERPEVRRWQE